MEIVIVSVLAGLVVIVIFYILYILIKWEYYITAPLRKRKWRKKVYPAYIEHIQANIKNNKICKLYSTWLNLHGEYYYLIGHQTFEMRFNQLKHTVARILRKDHEEMIQNKINQEYYEYQSRNRKSTDSV